MEQDALISVIVPVYKAEKYLDKCVRSILSQTYQNLEVILVDDGSPDRSGELCDGFAKEDARIRVIHQENGGVSAARNAGLDTMTGKYFCFVDSDDYLEPEMVERLYEAAKDCDAELTICGIKWQTRCGEKRLVTEPKTVEGKTEIARYFAKNYLAWFSSSPCAKLYRREKFGELRFDKQISLGEDLKFNIQYIVGIEKVTIIDACLYVYLEHKDSLTKTYKPGYYEAMCDICRTSADCFKQMLPENLQVDLTNVNYKLFSYCASFMAQNIFISDWKSERAFIKRICDNPQVQQAVQDLPPMPLPHRIYAWAINHKFVALLYVFSVLRNSLEKQK